MTESNIGSMRSQWKCWNTIFAPKMCEQLTMLVFFRIKPCRRSWDMCASLEGVFAITRAVPCVVHHV
jgi:hypothetical protein